MYGISDYETENGVFTFANFEFGGNVVMSNFFVQRASERVHHIAHTSHIGRYRIGTAGTTRVPVSGTNTCTVAVEVTRAVSCDREYVQRVVR